MTVTVRVLGVPTDYGTDRRGVDMGPSAIRYAGLQAELEATGLACTDDGDLAVPTTLDPATLEPDALHESAYFRDVEQVTTKLANRVATVLKDDHLPLVLGGDHSIAIGTINGAARDADLGVVWFDAHADYNTPETSPSGNIHGMPLAAVLGEGGFADCNWAHAPSVPPENVVWIGLRDIDPPEQTRIRESDATAYTMSDIDEHGIATVVTNALDTATTGVDAVHVSFDMDFIDPNIAPGVGTPVRGGATYREAHAALELVARHNDRHGTLRSLEFVEVNPIRDHHNETATLATELTASALGKRIL